MRKELCICIVAMSIFATTGCTTYSNDVLNAPGLSRREDDSMEDRIIYSDLDSLIDASDLVVIGKFIQKDEQTIEYTYSEEFGKDIVTDAVSTNVIQIEKILAGETNEEELTISQRYAVDEKANLLVTFSDMTTMNKGAEWIFFLFYDETSDTYWCAGDYTGRYPVPIEGKTYDELDSTSTSEFGVYDETLINLDLYNEIISTFDCTL